MRVFRNHKKVTFFVGPYVTAFSWSRGGTFGVTTREDGSVPFSRFRFWLARWWSGIGRWRDED
jgi:hypothetical protein